MSEKKPAVFMDRDGTMTVEGGYINHGPWRIPYHHRSTLHYARTLGVPLEIFVNDNDASYLFFENGKGPLRAKAVRKRGDAPSRSSLRSKHA